MRFSGRQCLRGAAALYTLFALIIVTGGAFAVIKYFVSATSTVQFIKTRDNLADSRRALLQFIQDHNRLPCPASIQLSPTAPNYGVEDSTSQCSQTLRFPVGT